ncbi:MAG: DUF2207 domain-containing protein, partial [bacterium]|nr:DUF2207 domain-containing protein [bacterium]
MKKILVFLSVLLFPFLVNASHLDEDITILENGDVLVKEAISIDGSYNGFELKLKYKYNGDYEIYSADDLEIVKVCESDKTNSLTDIGACFSQVDYATKGDSLLYTQSDYDTSTTLMLYNPSIRKKAFYVEYILKNVVISHNDIAELRLNMLSTDLTEDFDKINIKVNLSKPATDLRAWAHGPLWGNIKLSDNKDYALFTIEDYSRGTGVDIRMTFDKELINTEKTTNVDMLDKIIEEETILADQANKERNSVRALLENEKRMDKIITIISGTYIISLVVLTIVMYNKYDKEYKSAFNNKYYREFPSNDSPEVIEYLIKKNISTVGYTACILNIIYKKGLIVEPITTTSKVLKKEKTDYILKFNDKNLKEKLTIEEEKLRTYLIDEIGDEKQFKLSDLKKVGNTESSARKFIKNYNDWLRDAKKNAETKNFYEKSKKGLPILYSFVPILIATFAKRQNTLLVVAVFAGIVFMIYILTIKKRSKEGNELFTKWNALKNFMVDFGKFKDKELPEITLWEKYLVYAHVFGIATKLRKTMELKVPNLDEVMDTGMTYRDYWYINN